MNRHSYKGHTQMASEYLKRHSPLVTREMETETCRGTPPHGHADCQSQTLTSAGGPEKEPEPFPALLAGMQSNSTAAPENSLAAPPEVKLTHRTTWPSHLQASTLKNWHTLTAGLLTTVTRRNAPEAPVNEWVSHKEEYSSDVCVKNLENMLSERHQTQKTTCFMIPFIWNGQDRQIHRSRKKAGVSGHWRAVHCTVGMRFSSGATETFLSQVNVTAAHCECTNTTELFTLR